MRSTSPFPIYLALPVVIYCLTRWIYFFASDQLTYLLIDYAGRLAVLVYIICIPATRKFALECYRQPWPDRGPAISWTFLLFASAVLQFVIIIKTNAYFSPLHAWFEGSIFFVPMAIDPGWLRIIDLSFGLALVAISEELMFRAFLLRILAALFDNQIMIVLTASVIFGLMHWPGGFGKVIITSVSGLIFIVAYLNAKSLWPSTLAHYLINLFYFAGY